MSPRATPQNYSTLFGKIVLSKFDTMPEWARVCAFFVALIVLVYITLHSLNAKYFVTGTVLEPSPVSPDSNQAARGYDVRWDENYAGTNSKGHYVFVLSPGEYFSLLTSGKHPLQIWKPGDKQGVADLQTCAKTVTYNRQESMFDDYYLDASCHGSIEHAAPSESGFLSGLVPAVHAEAISPQSSNYRLLATTLRFGTQWPRSNSAAMELFQNGQDIQLLDLAGTNYGGIIILPGGSLAFPDGVNLPTPSLAGGRIRLSDKSGLFTFTQEWFNLPSNPPLGRKIPLKGDMGSELTVIPLGPSIATIFRKDGDAAYYAQLAQDLLSAGVLPMSSPSPMGPDKITNALFIGSAVPPSTVKSVVSAVVKNGVQLRGIAYPYKFKSTSDPARIQLGWAPQCVKVSAIKQEDFDRLAKTSNEQTIAFLQRFGDCANK